MNNKNKTGKSRKSASGRKKGDVIIAGNGRQYVLLERLGRGGQGIVWKVCDRQTRVLYAYKEYEHNANTIKSNIKDLIEIGTFYDKDHKPVDPLVTPIALVETDGERFGYIMELVDLKNYTTVLKAWDDPAKYPSCRAICKIMMNFSRVLDTLHITYGMSYKDVNEGNIFFDPITGDIKIIDNDNIGYSSKGTIKGTPGYRAPEIVLGDVPDHNSDRFSLAVFAYRLLTGGYPFDGPMTDSYCTKTGSTIWDAEKVVYGSNAVFSWDPIDKRNCLENSTDMRLKRQAEFWKMLPRNLKDLFISTFATNLPKERRAERPTNIEWYDAFAELERTLIKCPHCGAMTFKGSGRCFGCGEPMNNGGRVSSGHAASLSAGTGQRHCVKLKALSAGERARELTLHVGDVVRDDDLSKHLPSGSIFKILYNIKNGKMGIKNLSDLTWKIAYANNTRITRRPGEIAVLESGMKIAIITKISQLNIVDLN